MSNVTVISFHNDTIPLNNNTIPLNNNTIPLNNDALNIDTLKNNALNNDALNNDATHPPPPLQLLYVTNAANDFATMTGAQDTSRYVSFFILFLFY